MATILRLTRRGQHKRPFYRIVAANKEARRDGRFLEIVGTYNPMIDPPAITLKEDRIKSWLDSGAQASRVVQGIIEKQIPGLMSGLISKRKAKLQAARKKRMEKNPKAKVAAADKKPKRGRKSATKAAS